MLAVGTLAHGPQCEGHEQEDREDQQVEHNSSLRAGPGLEKQGSDNAVSGLGLEFASEPAVFGRHHARFPE